MAPVKKQTVNKLAKASKQEKKNQSLNETVVSAQLQKKIDKKQHKSAKDPKGVVFIKNLPHGFFEEQLKKYFEQFGNVTRVRLARSRRTGNSKGYAFVEFEYPEVAEVAAETMDNYLMFKQIVKASYIPPEKQQFNYFRTSVKKIRNKSGKLVWVSAKTADIQQKVKAHNNWNEVNFQKRTQKQLQKLQKTAEKYAHLGIDIKELVVQPKIMTEKKEIKATTGTGKNLVSKKKGQIAFNVTSSSKNTKASKNNVSLEDLLGNTMPEDTEDEDYVAMSESEKDSRESDRSSDEETYGFSKNSSCEDNDGNSEEDVKPIYQKKSKNSKSTFKVSNIDRFDEMLNRKPHAGGISKINKKTSKQRSVGNKKKAALQMVAAKELAKPLTKVKAKLSGPLKTKKSLIKSK